jgi:putative nucleotidyltransferase with HDIG domain
MKEKKQGKVRKKINNFFNIISKYVTSIYAMLAVIFVVTSFLFFPSRGLIYNLHVGDVSPQTIRAEENLLIEDKASTQLRINEAKKNVTPIFDFNHSVYLEVVHNVENSFSMGRNALPKLTTKQNRKKFETTFFKTIGIETDHSIFERLIRLKFSPEIERAIINACMQLKDKPIVSMKKGVGLISGVITVKDLQTGGQKQTKSSSIADVEKVKFEIYENIISSKQSYTHQFLIWDITKKLIRPNLFYNSAETKKMKDEAAAKVDKAFIQVKKGQVIVREGNIITTADYAKLTAMNMLKYKQNVIFDYARIILLLAAFGFSCYLIMQYMGKKYLKNENYIKLFLATFLLNVVVVKVYEYLASNISYTNALLSKISILYATPFACGAVLIALTISFEFSLIFAFLLSACAFLLPDKTVNMQIALYVFLGSAGGSLCISKRKERIGIIKTGMNISLISTALILLFSMHEGFFSAHTLISCAFGIVSGITVILIVSGILPIYEWLFGISTNIKLMELGNLNHTLLRELALKAPGTYQHSIAMSSLAEAAAQAIDADSVLAKVGAYYHDIGKMSKPLYFVENQVGGVNKHDKLSPPMSALILIDHVKEGILLANKYRLGRRIKDIIQQHHGTTLIKYFYSKAKEKKMDVKEEEFRYKGPKPQTREVGIMMIADQVEAISRTLSDPSISHIRQLVKKTTTDVFLDGQLDECELTLADLDKISNAFVKVLSGMFHYRIDYPEIESENGSTTKQEKN